MSGHSKWSKVKHQKATTDVAKAAAFTKASRAIMVAVREGGGITNPDDNFHLRLAVEQARAVNMPKENITRIIEKAGGEGGSAITTVTYEGYGPFGVALIIEATTDNIKRTVSFIKQALEYKGGAMAAPGATSYLFRKRGLLTIPKEAASYDDIFTIACEGGADDVVERDDVYEVYTTPTDLMRVKSVFDAHPFPVSVIGLIMDPMTTIPLPQDKRQQVESLIETLEELDDVQTVYSNLE